MYSRNLPSQPKKLRDSPSGQISPLPPPNMMVMALLLLLTIMMMISVMSFRRWKIWEGGMAISCRRRLRHFRLCRARSSILGLLTHNTGPKYSLHFFQIICILNTINTGSSNLQYKALMLQTLLLSPNTLYLKHNQYYCHLLCNHGTCFSTYFLQSYWIRRAKQ